MTEPIHQADSARSQQQNDTGLTVGEVRFKNPPVNELVIGVYFDPPLIDLRSEHIGVFWERVKGTFPKVEQRPPTVYPNILTTNNNEVFPLPRYFFTNEKERILLQLQKSSFFLNWGKGNSDYPHFKESLKPAFDKYYTIFSDFAVQVTDTELLQIGSCELTYVNIIGRNEYWNGPQDTSVVFPFLQLPEINSTSEGIPTCEHTYFYQFDSDILVKISIKDTIEDSKTNEPVLFFELKAICLQAVSTKSCADSWFDRAHDALLYCFLHTTSDDIQKKYWLPEVITNVRV